MMSREQEARLLRRAQTYRAKYPGRHNYKGFWRELFAWLFR